MTSFFPQKMVPECKPEWNREAITVFSRLPSLRRLQAIPLLQTSLGWDGLAGSKLGYSLSTHFGPMFLKDQTILVFFQPLCSSAVQCEDVS